MYRCGRKREYFFIDDITVGVRGEGKGVEGEERARGKERERTPCEKIMQDGSGGPGGTVDHVIIARKEIFRP